MKPLEIFLYDFIKAAKVLFLFKSNIIYMLTRESKPLNIGDKTKSTLKEIIVWWKGNLFRNENEN